ncbi:hypothetical protein [Bacillus yunxiaonensis]|uniref:hypothetical protein n=1 Tax=Bacillus yunxiaonensis TaxID=3127665 RepID=UPI0039B7629F
MDRRLITGLSYCFDISVCDITKITAVAIQYLILKKNQRIGWHEEAEVIADTGVK